MNEQIVKLSDEAYVYASKKNSIHSPQLLRDYTEKLAELIVKECADLCSDLDGGENMFSRGIRKHFGVE